MAFGEWRTVWQTAHWFGNRHTNFSSQVQHYDVANFIKDVDVIEWQTFRRKLCVCAGDFSLGKQRLVKSTPGVG